MKFNTKPFYYLWLPLLLVMSGCQSTPPAPGMKLGKPYEVGGKTYYPEYDPTYDKVGMASWYGPGFHGKYTASGEIYNQNDLTAAHPTLPMPSLVRVTNLSNGKSLIVRINDRGPIKSNRIIDKSKKAAQELGMPSTSEVRVQFLKKETEEYLASLETGGRKTDMTAYNSQAIHDRDSSIMHSTEPNDQVVENTISTSHAGQTITSAAPIMSVTSDALANETPKPAVSPEKPTKAAQVQISGLASKSIDTPLVSKEKTIPAKGKMEIVGGNAPTAFYIQAGSFASEENARKLSTKLDDTAHIDIGKVEMGAKTWWRVRLGPYKNQQEAAQELASVHEAGLPDARIVHQ